MNSSAAGWGIAGRAAETVGRRLKQLAALRHAAQLLKAAAGG